MSIISGIRNYLKICPYFDDIPIMIDYLSATATEVSLDGTPVPYVIKKYTDGSLLCRYSFTIGARFPWFGDEKSGFSANEWFENVSNWFDKMTQKSILPQLPDNLVPLKIEAFPNRFDYEGKNSSARYQMICGLTFYKKKG